MTLSRRQEIVLGIGLAVGLSIFSAIAARGAEYDANGNPAMPRMIGHRPAGCPHAWCGCGLAKYLGLDDRRLNRAWSWALLFPRTHAKEGAAAVRAHHVMLLEEHVSGTKWLVRDFNGGNHLAWLHVRDVRGYVFVDPSQGIAGRRQHFAATERPTVIP